MRLAFVASETEVAQRARTALNKRYHGVEPGETPPDSGSTTQSANQDPPPRSRMTPTGVAALIAVGVIFAIFLVVAVVYLLQVAGLMDRW